MITGIPILMKKCLLRVTENCDCVTITLTYPSHLIQDFHSSFFYHLCDDS